MNRVRSASSRTDCVLEVPDSIPTTIRNQGRRQQVRALSKKNFFGPLSRGRPAQILYAKSAVMTLSFTVS